MPDLISSLTSGRLRYALTQGMGTLDKAAGPMTLQPRMCLDGYRSAPGRSPV